MRVKIEYKKGRKSTMRTESRMKRSKGIFFKIFIASIICIIVPLIVSGVYISQTTSAALEDEAKRNLQEINIEKNKQIDTVFDLNMEMANQVASNTYTQTTYEELEETGELNPEALPVTAGRSGTNVQ